MNRFGITGGIGSGKTYVSRLLEQRGFSVFNCDTAARHLMLEDKTLQERLSDLLGEPALLATGQLNKKAIGNYLFASPEHVVQVNALVHPLVKDSFMQWVEWQEAHCREAGITGQWVGMECSILFESHFDVLVDVIGCVYAPENIRFQRVMKRDGLTMKQIEERMERQLPEADKLKRSDFVFHNDGREPLEPQLERFVNMLSSQSIPVH